MYAAHPLERVNREIGRRADIVGIFPDDAAAIRLAVALLIEQTDKWLTCRRYLSEESVSLLYADPVLEDSLSQIEKEVPPPKQPEPLTQHPTSTYTTSDDLTFARQRNV